MDRLLQKIDPLTDHASGQSSANTNDAVYDSRSRQEASSGTRHSGSGHIGHHKSSKSSGKAKHKSKKECKSSKTDAERKQQQEEDLTGVGSQLITTETVSMPSTMMTCTKMASITPLLV
ncbi:hypothetical protein PG995_010623 [Apiospora arundinis]